MCCPLIQQWFATRRASCICLSFAIRKNKLSGLRRSYNVFDYHLRFADSLHKGGTGKERGIGWKSEEEKTVTMPSSTSYDIIIYYEHY